MYLVRWIILFSDLLQCSLFPHFFDVIIEYSKVGRILLKSVSVRFRVELGWDGNEHAVFVFLEGAETNST